MTTASYSSLRNIAIIAHVDHGKTTLVDQLLRATGAFRENQQVAERFMDSNDQERERGITILAKNTAIFYRDTKINVIDTPGHADFGGEVERVLKMADGALLIVDAFEGPMPQTRFVLRHAIALGLKIVLVVNKIDRPQARPTEVLDEVFDLMVELGASDAQLDFPVIYASAMNGYALYEPTDPQEGMEPLLETIIESIEAPESDENATLALQVCTIDHSTFVGRIAIGRLYAGSLHPGDKVLVIKQGGDQKIHTIKSLYTFNAFGRVEADVARAGDIVAVVGIENADIGDMITLEHDPVVLEPIHIDKPTLSVIFEASTSPLVGKDGDIVGSRQLKERLEREAASNVTMQIEELEDKSGVAVAGRGILHLSVLMETMRREGYEFQVGRPRVIFEQDEQGNTLEPIELAVVEVQSEFAGKVIEVFGATGGEMTDMVVKDDLTHLEFHIPTRGMMGLRNRLLNVTHGNATFYHTFFEYGPMRGNLGGRKVGSMISMTTEKSVAYALDTLQQRGTLFIGPGEDCYEGMIVGQASREGDLVVNIAKSKQLTNTRAASADKAILLSPPQRFTLEEALEYIEDDELVEITPLNIRLRKRLLTENERRKARAKQMNASNNV